jgi:hypothetical protein
LNRFTEFEQKIHGTVKVLDLKRLVPAQELKIFGDANDPHVFVRFQSSPSMPDAAWNLGA